MMWPCHHNYGHENGKNSTHGEVLMIDRMYKRIHETPFENLGCPEKNAEHIIRLLTVNRPYSTDDGIDTWFSILGWYDANLEDIIRMNNEYINNEKELRKLNFYRTLNDCLHYKRKDIFNAMLPLKRLLDLNEKKLIDAPYEEAITIFNLTFDSRPRDETVGFQQWMITLTIVMDELKKHLKQICNTKKEYRQKYNEGQNLHYSNVGKHLYGIYKYVSDAYKAIEKLKSYCPYLN